MRLKYPKIIIFCCVVQISVSCGKKEVGNGEEAPLKPEKSSLIYPNQNEACLSGVVVTPNSSEINFSWSVAQHTGEYEINVKNLLSGEVTKKVTKTVSLPLTLSVNTPYSWFIISRNGTETIQSDTWKFYNAGAATIYYPPFPADKLSPVMGQEVKIINNIVTLSWQGTDVDNDIVGYDLYMGQTPSLTLKVAGISANKTNVEVASGLNYYWKIITKDRQGNSSESDVLRFSVN